MLNILIFALLAFHPMDDDDSRLATEAILHAFEVKEESIAIAVTSCGCTRDDDFVFLVKPAAKGVKEVTVIRLKPDECDAAVLSPTWLEYSRKEVKLQGNKKIEVTNEFRPFVGSEPEACGRVL